MQPFTRLKLLKPIENDDWDLEEPIWNDEDTVSFYVPTWFDVNEYFEGINLNRDESEDYVNVYINYSVCNDEVSLAFVYKNELGYNEQDNGDFYVTVEMDEKTKEMFRHKILSEWSELFINRDDDENND